MLEKCRPILRFLMVAPVIFLVTRPYASAQETPAADTPLAACQRIAQSGRYYLTLGLNGAQIQISTPPELSPPYTGENSLERACIEIAASDVTLDCRGHVLSGAGGASDATAGIYIAGSAEEPLMDVSVENCVTTAHQFGLYAGHLEGGNIFHNTARRNKGIGFYLTGLSDVSVTANTAVGNDPDGMLLIGDTGVAVADNVAYYNRMRGITFEGCQGCLASRNESHSHGVLGFAIYGSQNMVLEENVAYDNRYHGFAILHEAGSATFRGNESYANESTGFFLQGSQDNYYVDNLSHDNTRDGIAIFSDSHPNTFEGNTLRDNGGYGVFSDAPIESATFAGNTFADNALGDTGSSDPAAIDWCSYTGFGTNGPCDPIFEGGPNPKDPGPAAESQAVFLPFLTVSTSPAPADGGPTIRDAYIAGDPIYYPSFGDLWMPTWADDDRLFLSWGDGVGFGDGYPVGYPAYESSEPTTVTPCGEEDYFPCWLWCNINGCDAVQNHPTAALTDAGVLAFAGPVPGFTDVSNVAIDVPTGEPFFLAGPDGSLEFTGRNDKPSSLLFYNGRLYLAGHSPAGSPVMGYLAYSDDYGRTWTEVPGSPWGATSNFRVLMFINMGRGYALNQDGYVYALGVGTEASWTARTVYLVRTPKSAIADYDAYEYFSGLNGADPLWSSNESEATPLDNLHTTGQASAMYHAGTARYLLLTTDAGPPEGPQSSGALFEAPHPWGPWTQVAGLCFLPECDDGSYNPAWTDGKYIAGLIPKGAGPNHVYFTIAGGDYHYQLQIGMLALDTGP
jgi:parallel beta-helix repeat protein